MAFLAMLAMGLGLMASPAEAAPFAYVGNFSDNTVSVIDTGTTPPSVVATVAVGPMGVNPNAVAVTPDGKHVYVANRSSNNVSVIDTTTNPNTVVATVGVGSGPEGVAVTPDGKHVYVANAFDGTVSVIETTGNTVMATVTVGVTPLGSASRRMGHASMSQTPAICLAPKLFR